MSYNTTLQSNNTDLQEVLEILQTKASGGEQATPEISVDSSGLITATAGTKSSTHQLAFQAAKTITPSTMPQIAVSSGYYTGGNITVAGDSNLVASNIKSGVSIFGVSGTLEEGGGSEIEDAIISRTISGAYTNDRVTVVGSYAFCYGTKITTVNFPTATSVSHYAFGYCTNLTDANFPTAISLNQGAFMGCTKLTTINFPSLLTIGMSAFSKCTSLTTVSFPATKSISANAFISCSRLTDVSFPAATNIGTSAFAKCTSLTTVSFPSIQYINTYAFSGCTNLNEFYMTGAILCSLANSNAFTGTAITSSTGSIYVPSARLSSYQTATNWTYFSTQFVGLDIELPDGIMFTIAGVAYEAEVGMTWEAWVNSSYNTGGYSVYDTGTGIKYIKAASGWKFIMVYDNSYADYRQVYASETIGEGISYTG